MTEIAGLNAHFQTASHYQKNGYDILPLRFIKLDERRYIATNFVGEYTLLNRAQISSLVDHSLTSSDPLYDELKSKHFIADGDSKVHLDLLAAKYRTKMSRLPEFTGLHLFVVTLRCEHSCRYCQVSRVSDDRQSFDMSEDTAVRAVEMVFKSPARNIKIEFQGGEPLLNFPIVKRVVEEAKIRNVNRNLQFVITTNLALIDEDVLKFCKEHGIFLSTSLDGPEALHNANRPRPGNDSYQRTLAGIKLVREKLGPDFISALMTTTAESLKQPESIIDEYVRLGFRGIFIRYMSPYGFAVKTSHKSNYQTKEFIEFFKKGLQYIIDLNLGGIPMAELYSTLILRKILTPFPTGFVDLQSPAGLGISAIVYNYNGDVFASDEGRMLAEMNDMTFRLGNLQQNSYEEIFVKSPLLPMIWNSMTEGIPQCSDCALEPYCGTDPVFHHATQGDYIGHRPTSHFCDRNMSIIKHLITLIEADQDAARVLRSWIR